MKIKWSGLIFVALMLLAMPSVSHGNVEISIQRTLNIEETPIDVVSSQRGEWIFVLTEQRNILVYSLDGKLHEKIPVDKSVDGIGINAAGDLLYLSSGKTKTVHIAAVDFIRDINTAGSPFKGPADAPVVITEFSDFQ